MVPRFPWTGERLVDYFEEDGCQLVVAPTIVDEDGSVGAAGHVSSLPVLLLGFQNPMIFLVRP